MCTLVIVLELLGLGHLMNLVYLLRNFLHQELDCHPPPRVRNLMRWSTGWCKKGLKFTVLIRAVPVSERGSYSTFGLAHAKDLQYFYFVMRALKNILSWRKDLKGREEASSHSDSFQWFTTLQWLSKLLRILTFIWAKLSFFFFCLAFFIRI